METAIGVVIGIVGTILVSRYYFHRSSKKELSAYRLLDSQIFEGIEPEIRRRLRFTFEDHDVAELSQIGFLIANTGERAISGFLEPPNIILSPGAKVLYAAIEHRHPEMLTISVGVEGEPTSGQRVLINVPLLNKGDYFVVRLLISGAVALKNLRLKFAVDDLPREIGFGFLPHSALRAQYPGIEWWAVGAGIFIMGMAFCSGYVLWLLHKSTPNLFVIPWATFEPSIQSVAVVVAMAVAVVLGLLGAMLTLEEGWNVVFGRGKRFLLPDHISRGHRYESLAEFIETHYERKRNEPS